MGTQRSELQSRGSKVGSEYMVDDLKNAKWIYERYNQVVTSENKLKIYLKKLPKLCEEITALAKKARDEIDH